MKTLLFLLSSFFIISCTETNEPIVTKPLVQPLQVNIQVTIHESEYIVTKYRILNSHWKNDTVSNDTSKTIISIFDTTMENVKNNGMVNGTKKENVEITVFNVQTYKRAYPSTLPVTVTPLSKTKIITTLIKEKPTQN